MADELLETYVRQLLESQPGPDVSIAWQGGEPTLMGLDFFERSVECAERHKRPSQTVSYTIQTNGTRLDAEWSAFFKEHRFLVGLSVDGPHALHDVYRFFRDTLKAAFIQFIPIVERATPEMRPVANMGWGERGSGPRPLYLLEGNVVTERSVTAAQWGRFLIGVFDEWGRRDVGRVYVQMFDAALASWVGAPASMCIFAETCGGALALEHNGDLYSCDHFVEPTYLLGNIQQVHMLELVASDIQRQFGLAKRDTLPRYCRECPVRFACHGECPKDRFISTPDGEPGLNYLCAGYKAFFTHIDRPTQLMAGFLRSGDAPARVMQVLAAEEAERLSEACARARRNDPCPCGSGRKFKHCHAGEVPGAATGER